MLDALLSVDDLFKKVKEFGQKAIAITDHGTLAAHYDAFKAYKKTGIKFIPGCLLKGQEIITINGVKCVDEIKIGDMVLTHKGKFKRVLSISKKEYSGFIYEIIFSKRSKRNSLKLTEEHPIFIRDNNGNFDWKSPGDIVCGRYRKCVGIDKWNSYVCLPKLEEEDSCIDLIEYLPKTFSSTLDNFIKNKSYEWKIPRYITMDKEFAYLLGLYTVEGSIKRINKEKINGEFVFSFGKNEIKYAKHVKDILKNKFNIDTNINIRENKSIIEVCGCCLPFAHFISSMCGIGSKNKKVPSFIFSTKKDIKLEYINGILDSDGKNIKSGCQNLHTSSKNLAWGIRTLLVNFDIWVTINEIFNNKESSYMLCIQLNNKTKFRRNLIDDKYICKPIREIKKEFKENIDVFNFEVEDNHSYVSDFILHNCEMYFVHSYDLIENANGKGKKKSERSKHLVLLAQNQEGYKNLLKINFSGYENYIMLFGRIFPRISWDILEKYSDGLICTSACLNGPISVLITDGKYDEAEELAQKFSYLFKDRFYIELQPHLLKNNNVDQDANNRQLITIAQKFGIPIVCATDTHYITRQSEKYHDVLMALNSKDPIDDPDRHRYGIDDFYVKTGEEVFNFLEKHYGKDIAAEAVGNTIKIADICEPPDYIISGGNHLPVFAPKDEVDYPEFLEWSKKNNVNKLKEDAAFMRFKVFKGFIAKFKHLPKEEAAIRFERVKKEFTILEKNNFSSYLLVVADFIKWAKEHEILVGVGRGCLAGDASVLTENGYKNLKDINTKDFVYTHSGKLKKVNNVFKYEINEDLLEIKTDFSFKTIKLTKDHLIYGSKAVQTKRREQSIKNNWKCYKEKKYNIVNNPSWFTTEELKKDDFLFVSFPQKKDITYDDIDLSNFICNNYTYDDNFIYKNIPKVNNFSLRKMAESIGISRRTLQKIKRNKGATCKKITLELISNYLELNNNNLSNWLNNKNVEIIKYNRFIKVDENFVYMIGRWLGDGWINDKHNSYSLGIAFNKNDLFGLNKIKDYFESLGFYCGICSHEKKELNQLYIYDRILTNLFRNLFKYYKDSSNTKYIGNFKYLSNDLLKSLMLGLKHSDGHTEMARESIDTTSIQLTNDIRESLLYLKIPTSVQIRKGSKSDNYICKKSYKIRFTGLETPVSSKIKSRIFSNGFFVQISNINTVYDNFVYDISVSDDHSYLTQNFAVHNSVGGSMVAYLLGIHGVDPLEYDLLFERFQNAEKKDLPDIDTDFTSAGRDLVQEYCRQKYGAAYCAHVSNINTYTPKNVIPGLVKSMRNVMPGLIPEGTNYVQISNAIKTVIPEKDGDGEKITTLEDAMAMSPKLRDFARRCPELMEYADVIVGLPKEFSTHAAGMVISDRPIIEFAPLRIDKNGSVAVQLEKNRCEDMGLVKMDFLAISTLDIIDETLKNIKRLGIAGAPCQMEDIPYNDIETYKMIQQGHTRCVFQLGKSGIMISLCKQIKPQNIIDIAVINALGRPACNPRELEDGTTHDERKEYIERRFGIKKVEYLHPSLEIALKQTYGLCIIEEQLMSVARDVAGWDLNKADGLRKLTKLKGKDPKLALKLEVDFIEGTMKKNDVGYEFAKKIWDEVVGKFSGYGFNKSHAVFYSINGYITAYLKKHYPAAFLAAYLKVKTVRGGVNKDDEIAIGKTECRRLGINIVPPDINRSSSGYEVLDQKTIVMGLSAIKGLGIKAVSEIVDTQPFETFTDFLSKTRGKVINKSKLEALSKAGCFDSLSVSRKDIFELGKKTRDRFNIWIKKMGGAVDGYQTKEEFDLKFTGQEWPAQQKLRHEQEVLGELVSGTFNELFPRFFTNILVTPLANLKVLPDRHEIITEIIVQAKIKEFKIKKENSRYVGQTMMKYRVVDVNGVETELTVWPSEVKQFKDLIGNGGVPIRAKCQVSNYNGVNTLMLRELLKVYGKK
jgi:DNA polymerase III alpha subunit/DNA-binding Xre family transcriptional regulator